MVFFPRILNVWWSLPQALRDRIADLVPKRDTWTLHVRKDASGVWTFSLPQFLIVRESLSGGSDVALDEHYRRIHGVDPKTGDRMTLVVSTSPLENTTTEVVWMYEDPLWTDANWYRDTVAQVDCWLCPVNQVLLGGVPETIYLQIS